MTVLGLGLFFLVITLVLELILFITRKDNTLKLNKNIKKEPRICVIIPARDEAKVIDGLLESITMQSYKIDNENVYIIVESDKDKSINIAKSKQMRYFVRKELDKKTKGYAIDELIKYLDRMKEYYDLYFIFDADNVLHKDFILNALDDYYKGYYVSTGFRGLKNPNDYLSLSTWLTFSILNDSHNTRMQKNNGNLILSGTGYFIEGSIIKDFKRFPFCSLTEDYESSLYYTLEGIATSYNKKAIFYDEQPTSYKVSIKQRARWIKGYFNNYFKYRKRLINKLKDKPLNKGSLIEMAMGVLPLITFIISILNFLIYSIFISIKLFLIELFIIYLALVILSIVVILKNRKHILAAKKVIFKTLFYHPIFLISYIHAFLKMVFTKNMGWDKIEHTKSSLEIDDI